jgi:ornithine cyclodeaminase/alanine dehydrogenase-like protein (mu-crystallin family)
MNVLVVSHADVHRLLAMDACIELVAEVLAATSRGAAVLPLRSAVWMPDRTGMIGLMPGFVDQRAAAGAAGHPGRPAGGAPATVADPRRLGLKVVSIFPGNHGTGYDSHQGVVLLFDPGHGTPIAIIDASSITAIRTAAASAVATRALARPDASDLAILGSGVQATSHLAAMRAVRPIRRVRVWSRNSDHAHRFAAASPIRVDVMATAQAAVDGADLICTTTAARTPILEGAWLAPGAHVNAVGACFASARELDTAAVARARLIVDSRASALAESGDFLLARADGAITDAHLAGELGDVLLGRVAGRRSPDEITLFESLGIAVEDLAAAHHVYARALATASGVCVPLGP